MNKYTMSDMEGGSKQMFKKMVKTIYTRTLVSKPVSLEMKYVGASIRNGHHLADSRRRQLGRSRDSGHSRRSDISASSGAMC